MLRNSADYLDLFGTAVIAWQWLELAAAAREWRAAGGPDGFCRAQLAAAQYWFATEVPRIALLADRCRAGDDAYAALDPDDL